MNRKLYLDIRNRLLDFIQVQQVRQNRDQGDFSKSIDSIRKLIDRLDYEVNRPASPDQEFYDEAYLRCLQGIISANPDHRAFGRNGEEYLTNLTKLAETLATAALTRRRDLSAENTGQ